MRINGKYFQTIWLNKKNEGIVHVIDQRHLPFRLKIKKLKTLEDAHQTIKNMVVRGAPLIGVTASFGMYLALLENRKDKQIQEKIKKAANYLKSARPTAINLAYAVDQQLEAIEKADTTDDMIAQSKNTAIQLKEREIDNCRKIGEYGLPLIRELAKKKNGEPVNILTHCNAGWLACIDYGTATAPVYLAHNENIPLHVWVDETRPRNQGSKLTAFEMSEENIPHTVITDNAGGMLMQQGKVDMVIVGSDRTAANGDVANKIGTYLKALAAHDNHVPFYVALPLSSIDMNIESGMDEIPIEQRAEDEVTHIEGFYKNKIRKIRLTPKKSRAANYGFDVTPADYVNKLITEKGVCNPDKKEIKKLFAS